ncbi:hypothetical protein SAMN02745746_03005 [Pseudogulbenkiania subflava DSM 22618]|uniref:Uncharacterized protein n=2 Tax=Pseudogulbenkiania subflava TaxID=451637 RepID=A0A1Y6C6X6_9NEIS|nr:hypothetical protein SAMN02745746_03005 [Pseudogulbenkiania subflava DSM 22618]
MDSLSQIVQRAEEQARIAAEQAAQLRKAVAQIRSRQDAELCIASVNAIVELGIEPFPALQNILRHGPDHALQAVRNKVSTEINLELSYELQLLLDHFEQNHYAPDNRSSELRSKTRVAAEHFLTLLANGNRNEETLIYAQSLAGAIRAAGLTPGRQEASKENRERQKKRPQAVLRATGLGGHAAPKHRDLVESVMTAEGFEVNHAQAIREALTAGLTDLVPKEAAKEIRRMSRQ